VILLYRCDHSVEKVLCVDIFPCVFSFVPLPVVGMRQDEYIRQLQVLQDIRDKCVGQLNLRRLMQICVVGDQSSGKSSALACISGIAFPVKSRIGTKAPIVVECRHDPTLELPVFEIQDRNSQLCRPVDLRALASEIENIQNQLLNSDGISGSNPERPKICYSSDEIRVKVRGPEQIDLVVVESMQVMGKRTDVSSSAAISRISRHLYCSFPRLNRTQS
jgi:hypothetical protein